MVTLCQLGSGSGGYSIGDALREPEEWEETLGFVRALLRERGYERALEISHLFPFKLYWGYNDFEDVFAVLAFSAPIKQYVEIENELHKDKYRMVYRQLAEAVSEISKQHVRFVAMQMLLEKNESVSSPHPKLSARVTVRQALRDAEQLLSSQGAISAVDRVHTALHGFMEEVCDKAGIARTNEDSITGLFSVLKKNHPALKEADPHKDLTKKINGGIATILDALNTIRNRASMAHPNEDLLKDAEAHLVLNAAKTIFHYLDEKCRS
jgi:hypothetical protein